VFTLALIGKLRGYNLANEGGERLPATFAPLETVIIMS
jgi:hypothetical protein